jgi:two-component system cell cycle response regulator DivK
MAKRGTPTILVIEDYSEGRILLSAWLRGKGYKVVEAKDGREGLLQANRVTPDLILMDLTLPEIDGVEATRQIRKRHLLAHTPIFAISGFATHEVRTDAIAAGCTAVFTKPLNLDALLGKIKDTLGS